MCLLFQFVGQRFHKVTAAQRIHRVGCPTFVGDDLLRAQGHGHGVFTGQGQRFVHGVGVQRLCAAQHRSQCLDRHARHVVQGLLRCQADAGRLRVKTHEPGSRILRAKGIAHLARPNTSCCPVLGNLLEDIVVPVEEKRNTRCKIVYIQATVHGPTHILESVSQCKSQFLGCR